MGDLVSAYNSGVTPLAYSKTVSKNPHRRVNPMVLNVLAIASVASGVFVIIFFGFVMKPEPKKERELDWDTTVPERAQPSTYDTKLREENSDDFDPVKDGRRLKMDGGPDVNPWDALMMPAHKWLDKNLHDPRSMDVVDVSIIRRVSANGEVRYVQQASIRAKNPMGATVLQKYGFSVSRSGELIVVDY